MPDPGKMGRKGFIMDKMNRVEINNCLGIVILDWIESILLEKEVIDELLWFYGSNNVINVFTRLYITACELEEKGVREELETSLRKISKIDKYKLFMIILNPLFYNEYVHFSVCDGCTGEGIHYLISLRTGKWISYSDGVADGEYDTEYDELFSKRVQEWLKENIPEFEFIITE